VHTGIVEIIAIDPPCLVENLRPFRVRINADLDGIGIDFSLTLLDLVGKRLNECRIPQSIENLFLVG
jgi:hypothetical protein